MSAEDRDNRPTMAARYLGSWYLGVWSAANVTAAAWRRWRWGASTSSVPPLPSDLETPIETRGAQPRRRILVVSPYSLHPPIHGGAVRISNLIRRLASTFDVYLLIFVGGTDDPEQAAAFADDCAAVFFAQQPRSPTSDRWGLRPAALATYTAEATAERIHALVDAHRIDLVMLEYTEMAGYRGPYPGVPVVLVEHDIGFRTQARQRALDFGRRFARHFAARGDTRDLRRLRFAEVRACRTVARVHTMSEDDARFLAPWIGADAAVRMRVVPNGVDTHVYRPRDSEAPRGASALPDGRDVLFVGSFPHLPNRDALAFFVAEIWPQIRRRHPNARLTVAGARPTDDVLSLDGIDGITVAGEVDHLAPLYRDHALLVVPLRAGSGTRLKIMEALASGLPIVSTTLGAEGIRLDDVAAAGVEPLVLADGATAFAKAVGDLIDDPERRARIAQAGRAVVKARYDWDAIARGLAADLTSLLPPERHDAKVAGPSSESHPARHASIAVSVVVLTGTGRDRLPAVLDAVAGQNRAGDVEMIVITREGDGSSVLEGQMGASMPIETVTVPETMPDGVAFNRGCRLARGAVLALITADAAPNARDWLSRLVAPFDTEAPPSVVQGGVDERCVENAPAHRLATSAPERAWVDRHGFVLSWSNLAVRREVWRHHPFGADPSVEPLRWQRRVASAGHLILPILDVRVDQRQPWSVRSLFAAGWRRGAALRWLGQSYGVADLVRDVAEPQSFDQGRRWLLTRPVTSGAERLLPWLWPLAVFGGRWMGRRPGIER